jgi:hypothetical protein
MLFNIHETQTRTVFVFFALCIFFVSELFLVLGSSGSVMYKLVGLLILIAIILSARYIHKISIILIPLFVILIYNFYTALNYNAASEELLRFLFPIIILLSLHARLNVKTLARLLIYFVISNDLFQMFYYVSYFLNFPLLYEPRIEYSYILRAEGWFGFFSLFGFLNFCGYLLVSKGDFPKEKKYQNIFLIFMFLSTSLKVIVGFFIYLMITSNKKRIKLESIILTILVIILLVVFGGFFDDYTNLVVSKFNFYILEGNSARSESYRVLYAEVIRGNLFGAGLGTFGGPSSTAYDSVMYYDYNFNWYGLEGVLSTTDTFYPHLFIELGVIGGLLYLILFIFYGYQHYNTEWFALVIVFLLDNAMSFSLLSPPYVMTAIITLHYLQNHEKKIT